MMPDFYTWNDETEKADFMARSFDQEERAKAYGQLSIQSVCLINWIQKESLEARQRLTSILLDNKGKAGCLGHDQISELIKNIEAMKTAYAQLRKIFI